MLDTQEMATANNQILRLESSINIYTPISSILTRVAAIFDRGLQRESTDIQNPDASVGASGYRFFSYQPAVHEDGIEKV